MSKKKPTPETWRHESGRDIWGYDVKGNQYRLAQCAVDRFNKIQSQAEGLDAMVRGVTAYASEQHALFADRKRRFWDDVLKNIGADRERVNATYQDGIVTLIEKPKPEVKS